MRKEKKNELISHHLVHTNKKKSINFLTSIVVEEDKEGSEKLYKKKEHFLVLIENLGHKRNFFILFFLSQFLSFLSFL